MLRGESQTGVRGYWAVLSLTEDEERKCDRSFRTQASMAYILHMERKRHPWSQRNDGLGKFLHFLSEAR